MSKLAEKKRTKGRELREWSGKRRVGGEGGFRPLNQDSPEKRCLGRRYCRCEEGENEEFGLLRMKESEECTGGKKALTR